MMKYATKDKEHTQEEPAEAEAVSPSKQKSLAKRQSLSPAKMPTAVASIESEAEYKSPLTKFDIMSQFFGIQAIRLQPTGGNDHRARKQVRALRAAGSLISHDP